MTKRTQNYSMSHLVNGLSLGVLRHANRDRCESRAFNHKIDDWTPAMWACALAGEVGELCNLIKKEFRGLDKVSRRSIEDEIADVAIYLDLLAARYKIDLSYVICRKFNEVSRKRKSNIRIT